MEIKITLQSKADYMRLQSVLSAASDRPPTVELQRNTFLDGVHQEVFVYMPCVSRSISSIYHSPTHCLVR